MLSLIFLPYIIITSSHGIQTTDTPTSTEQLGSMYEAKNEASVPNYEVVSTIDHQTSTSDIRVLQIKNFKRDIKLYLEPVRGVLAGKYTPVWTVQSDRGSPLGLKYTRVPNALDNVIQLYQDTKNNAAITTRYDDDGNVHFEGTIDDNLVIRQLPSELRENLSRSRRSVYRDDLPYNNYHVLIELPGTRINSTRKKRGSYVPEKVSSRPKRKINVPSTIYPQVLVIVDYDISITFKNNNELMQYILSFWNAVDLRYRVFENPNIRINIAGIVIPKDLNATPYLTDHRFVTSDGRTIIDADKALDDSGRYFYDEMTNKNTKRFVLGNNYDAIMIMTKSDLCNSDAVGDDEYNDCATLGYSFRGGACTVNAAESLVEAIGLVEDRTGYTGIIPAAHELGHLFGARHDGRRKPNKLICPPYGYIMSSSLSFNENTFVWSYCSAEDIEDFFRSPKAECLFDEPNVGTKVPRVLPGKILSLDKQCNRIGASYACNPDSSACIRLDCFDVETGECIPIAPAAEGSSCGIQNYCINGRCVDKATSIIPLEIAPPLPAES